MVNISAKRAEEAKKDVAAVHVVVSVQAVHVSAVIAPDPCGESWISVIERFG